MLRGGQPAAPREPGGLGRTPAGFPRRREPPGRAGRDPRASRSPAAGAGSAPSSQPGAPVGGELLVFWKFNWEGEKKKKKNTWQCHFVRIPRRGWNVLGVALPGERFPTCPGTVGSAEGLPQGQRAGAEPTLRARQSCCRGFNPCSEPTGNFFFVLFCFGFGFFSFFFGFGLFWFFFWGAITLLPLKIAL